MRSPSVLFSRATRPDVQPVLEKLMIDEQTCKLPCAITAHWTASMLGKPALATGVAGVMEPIEKVQAVVIYRRMLDEASHPRAISAVGYANSADCLSSELGATVAQSRSPLSLGVGDSVLLCMFSGRLNDFDVTPPLGVTVSYFVVTIEEL